MDTVKLAVPFLLDPSNDPPRRRRVLASHVDADGVGYVLCANHPHTRWWLTASWQGGYRAGRTLTTTSQRRADEWKAAVAAGRVAIDRTAAA